MIDVLFNSIKCRLLFPNRKYAYCKRSNHRGCLHAGFKNLLLEKKLNALNEALEQKEAQLNEVLARANLDPSVLGQVSVRLTCDICRTRAHMLL